MMKNRRIAALAIALAASLAAATGVSAATGDTLKIKSANLPEPVKVLVISPDEAGARNGKTFPTVYLLNGFGGNHTSWSSLQPRLYELSDEYGMIFVMPDGLDSWYWDSPRDPKMKMETFVTKELVPMIDRKYPTRARRGQRAISGLSMGGHGAWWLAIRNPGIFGSAGSTSGGVNIMPFAKKWKMEKWLGAQAAAPEVWKKYTVASLLPGLKEKGLNLILDCGSEDFFAGVNAELHKALLDAGVPHDYISRPGTHNQAYWRNSILYQLLFFDENFKKDNKE